MPASELWLRLLQCVELLFFADGPAEIVGRLREGIAFLEDYQTRGKRGASVEQICETWVMSFDGETGRGAFVDTDFAQVLRERDEMGRERRPGIGLAM